MPTITNYHRPSSVDEALALLGRTSAESVILAGGTVVNAEPGAGAAAVIDLQAAVGGEIEHHDGRVNIGAMARLQDLVDHPDVPALLGEVARREGPNTFRNAASVGGTVARADRESELLAGLLVHEATVEVHRSDRTASVALADLLTDLSTLEGGIITSVSIEIGGATATERVGRTPADSSIVAAVGRMSSDGPLLAITGVAATPVLVDPASVGSLSPPGDFRGSPEYRLHLAEVLAARVLHRLRAAS